jgi:uncharacterized protein with NAD-binding domain and iron-sulfur cluster
MHDTPARKEKIAILGGGMAALTAAFELTSRPDHRDRYDITVYQMGFRLGGKGASGRNAAHAHRIEEHGLHILMGFYDNAFDLLRRCYAELGRPAGAPLATVDEAVKAHNYLVVAEEVEAGRWEPWELRFPDMPGSPGVGPSLATTPWEYLKRLLQRMWSRFERSEDVKRLAPNLPAEVAKIKSLLGYGSGLETIDEAPPDPDVERRALEQLFVDMERSPEQSSDGLECTESVQPSGRMPTVYLFLAEAAARLNIDCWRERALKYLGAFRAWLSKAARCADGSTSLRRLATMLDLGLTTAIGALEDEVDKADDGWFSLDDWDFRAWLKKHGAEASTFNGALVQSLYNLAFSGSHEIAAGTIIHATLRILLDYKGGVFQKMQAGMGDVIFAPLYLVLKERGVKFEFFHRVDALVPGPGPGPGEKHVAAIEIGVQARPKGGHYDPLYDVDGLPCWPSEPLYDRIENGDAIRASGQNLESAWSTWPDVEKRRLVAGTDFDRVILGIAIGAFPTVCAQLLEVSPRLRDMVQHVKTTQTQAVQIWFEGNLESLGWAHDSPVLDAFAAPFDTWADMSHLLERESWEGPNAPKNVAYLCSHLDDDHALLQQRGVDVPAIEGARVRENAVQWLNQHAHNLWPAVAGPEKAGPFEWSRLHDAKGREGEARLDAHYWQATFCPSERYVLSVPGSTRHRLRAHEAGFANLVFAGDWVRNGMNAGCVEGAVMGGMQAARAISGYPEKIPGDG